LEFIEQDSFGKIPNFVHQGNERYFSEAIFDGQIARKMQLTPYK
jgi:hypothetical protein